MVPPKAILFDLGGVCVLSPFQAIIDYEDKHGIPSDWINFAIARSGSNGHWQRLERGEIKMDADFFKGFNSQLHNQDLWREYHESFRNGKNKLKHIANPTQLGDHVSLKAEAADSEPTDQDRGAQPSPTSSSASSSDNKSVKEFANPTQIGDPTSLKAETSSTSPTGNETGAKSSTSDAKHHKTLKELANPTQIGDPVSLKAEETSTTKPTDQDLGSRSPSSNKPNRSSASPTPNSTITSPVSNLPPLPKIDGEALFWSMMEISRSPDPYVYPALLTLRNTNKFVLGALTNTVIFPQSHPYSGTQTSSPTGSAAQGMIHQDLRSKFDIFVASSEVGLRKPHPEIYKLALKQLDEFEREKGRSGVKAGDVLFLDDIGQNLKTAKDLGMRTLRVRLGKTWRAVKELERETGVELMSEEVRRSKL